MSTININSSNEDLALFMVGIVLIMREEERTFNANRKRKLSRQTFPRNSYHLSPWSRMLKKGSLADDTHRDSALFRRRFGIPYPRFQEILLACQGWNNPENGKPYADIDGRIAVPLELKVLGALRIVAKGLSFDGVAEITGMSVSTMQTFFHNFWALFRTHYGPLWINYPKTPEEAKFSASVYEKLGLPGAVGSVDVTHVRWDKAPAGQQSFYIGKDGKPTVAFEVTCNHHRRILHVTDGHPGSRNDKYIAKTDEFVQAILSGQILQDVEVPLYTANGSVDSLRGLYLISDNGYTKVPKMQCPIKCSTTDAEQLWSCHIESVRKDIECTFGILKGRFRILRTAMNFQTQAAIDTVFYACCIMHNMNLRADGRDKEFSVPLQDWVNDAEAGDDEDLEDALMSMEIAKRAKVRRGNMVQPEIVKPRRMMKNAGKEVKEYDKVRDKLVAHYSYVHKFGLVKWN